MSSSSSSTPQAGATATGDCATATSSPPARSQIPPDIGSLLDATNTSAAGDSAGQPAHRRRRGRPRPSAASDPNCPASSTDRRRWRSRRGKTVDPITAADRPVARRCWIPRCRPSDSIADVGAAHGVDHRAAQGPGRRLRRSAQPGRPRARRGQGAVRPGRARAAGAAGQPGQPRRHRGHLPRRHRAAAGALPAGHRRHVGDRARRTPDTKQDYQGIYLDFNLNLNLPPPCNTGFLPVQQQRSPSDVGRPRPARRRAVLPGPAGLRRSMSVACATFRARPTRPSGRRRSRCAKATSSTCRSTTASTGRATPTRRCPARASRSTRPARSAAAAARGYGRRGPPTAAAPPPCRTAGRLRPLRPGDR